MTKDFRCESCLVIYKEDLTRVGLSQISKAVDDPSVRWIPVVTAINDYDDDGVKGFKNSYIPFYWEFGWFIKIRPESTENPQNYYPVKNCAGNCFILQYLNGFFEQKFCYVVYTHRQTCIYIYSKVGDRSWGWPKRFLFNSYNTLPLVRTLYYEC